MIRFAIVLVVFAASFCRAQGDGLEECGPALNRGDFAQAAAIAGAYLKAHPESARALVISAQAHMGQGDSPSAYRDLREALKLEPRNIDALYYLGKLSNVLAQAELQRLYRLAPDSARVHQLMADSFHARGDSANEEKEYLAALKVEPRSVAVLTALGDLTRFQARYEEAISYYSEIEKLNASNYDALYGLGACSLFREQPEKAVDYFRRALKTEPDSAPARFALGDALMRTRRDEEAATELNAVVSISPGMKQAYALLGRVYQRMGRTREAERAFQRFRALSRAEAEPAALRTTDK